jgi:hypothetical protein
MCLTSATRGDTFATCGALVVALDSADSVKRNQYLESTLSWRCTPYVQSFAIFLFFGRELPRILSPRLLGISQWRRGIGHIRFDEPRSGTKLEYSGRQIWA